MCDQVASNFKQHLNNIFTSAISIIWWSHISDAMNSSNWFPHMPGFLFHCHWLYTGVEDTFHFFNFNSVFLLLFELSYSFAGCCRQQTLVISEFVILAWHQHRCCPLNVNVLWYSNHKHFKISYQLVLSYM